MKVLKWKLVAWIIMALSYHILGFEITVVMLLFLIYWDMK